MSFTMRVTKPEAGNRYYIRKASGGWSNAIQGSPKDAACDVLAMAVYACLRWPEDLEQAFIAAVNHDGPSDVVAAVTGSILGAHRGMQCLQPEWLEPLELRGIVEDVAMDLYNDCQMHKDSSLYDDDWNERYILCRY